METPPAERADLAHLRVQLHLALTQVALSEALVCRDRVDLAGPAATWAGTPAAQIGLGFQVVDIESLLAGARGPGDAAAVTQGELQLHEDALPAPAADPAGLQPVVLVGLQRVAYLVCADGTVVLVHAADLLPLGKRTNVWASQSQGAPKRASPGVDGLKPPFPIILHPLLSSFPIHTPEMIRRRAGKNLGDD